MQDIIQGIIAHMIVASLGMAAGYFVHKNILRFMKLFDASARAQAKLLTGQWRATEIFSDDNSQAQYDLVLSCKGAQVTGTQTYVSGRADKERTFDVYGVFENLVLNLTWTRKGSVETGAITLRFVGDNQLEGHGLYVFNQKVYTSVFYASKR